MTITTQDYAALDKDSYNVPEVGKKTTIGGVSYTVVDYYSNPVTGYQGTAYQRVDTGEVVIASRGTEPSGGTVQDAVTDLGMVVTGFNAQLPDARAFAKRVQENVDATAARRGILLPTITVTGHSLGGALTEALAYENHWHGETFNGFGAVDLQYNIPEGGAKVINHVRVTDVVSAANRHFGEVRYYATQEDIETLNKAGYTNATTPTTLRNPFGAIRLSAHSINNFAPGQPSVTSSDLSLENETRAQAHMRGILLWRNDIHALRSNTLSAGWELAHKSETVHAMLWEAGYAALHGDLAKIQNITNLARHRAEHNATSAAETALNTATLYAKGVQHTVGYVDDKMREVATHAWTATEGIRHDAAQAWQRTSNAMDRRSDAIKQQAQATYGEIKRGAEELHHRANVAVDSVIERTTKAVQHGVDVVHYNVQAASQAIDEGVEHAKVKARAAGEAVSSAAHSVSDGLSQVGTTLGSVFGNNTPAPSLNHPAHPDHAFYNDALKAVKHLDASQGRAPDHRSERLAAALTVAARREGLSGIDHAVLSDDASRTFGIQGELRSSSMRVASVDTALAVRTPIEQHSRDWQQLAPAPQEAPHQRQICPRVHPMSPAHAM